MKLCLSQYRSAFALETNVRKHVEVLEQAASAGCELVVFPELSLTGYGLRGARAQALRSDDARLHPLRRACDALGISALCGVPLRCDGGVEIGALIIRPGQALQTYAKQQLHADETPFFVPGTRDLSVRISGHTVMPGICYESVLPKHIAAAAARGATLYAASVAKPAAAIADAHVHYATMARRHGLVIVVANAVGDCEGFVAAGRSAAWGSDGATIASLESDDPGQLIIEM